MTLNDGYLTVRLGRCVTLVSSIARLHVRNGILTLRLGDIRAGISRRIRAVSHIGHGDISHKGGNLSLNVDQYGRAHSNELGHRTLTRGTNNGYLIICLKGQGSITQSKDVRHGSSAARAGEP